MSEIENNNENQTKKCPFCGEDILAIAKKCKYCGEWLDKQEQTKQCPFCAEMIPYNSIKCPYCDEKLEAFNIENKFSKDIKDVIIDYIDSVPNQSTSILTYKNITNDILNKYGVYIENNEIPLIMLYKSGMWSIGYTKLLITDKKVYYKTFKNSFFTGLLGGLLGMDSGSFSIKNSERIEIAEHDCCFGTAYVGHQLKKEDFVLGLVRMGDELFYDEYAILYLNGLFDYLHKRNILKYPVREYSWQ